jgi:hypothetical protein
VWEAWPDLLRIFGGAVAALVLYVVLIAALVWLRR